MLLWRLNRFNCSILSVLVCSSLFAQPGGNNNLESQIPKPATYNPAEVIDSTYGIRLYERLNFRLGGDSVRYCKGYSCSGWIEDFYDGNKQMIHRGYYVEGQLKIYKNFYPSGQVEREFRVIDDFKSMMRLYYENGQIKSQVKYYEDQVMKWEDYYENGQLEYLEEYNGGLEYYLSQNSYFEDGTPQMIFEIVSKKKKIYDSKEYYKNGQIKEEGQSVYVEDLFDYQRIGKWSYYDESGKLTREEFYENGKVYKDKDY